VVWLKFTQCGSILHYPSLLSSHSLAKMVSVCRPVHAGYSVKNTFVELAPQDAEFSRGARAMSANDAENVQAMLALQCPQDDKFIAQTPSPFLHPAQAPNDAFMNMLPLSGYEMPGNGMPTAFGDFNLSGFDENGEANYNQAMMYDPSSGMYMAYPDWQNPYNQAMYPMMNFGMGGDVSMQQNGGDQTEHLLQALGEKLTQGKQSLSEEGSVLYGVQTFDENGLPVPEVMGGPCDALPGQEVYMDPCAEIFPAMDLPGSGGLNQEHGQNGERSGRKSRNRDRGDRGERGERGDRADVRGNAGAEVRGEVTYQQGSVDFTTVMFRNIPNKYTREMLVKQLEQNLKGLFDFVYLPIDFKNKCNVGYAFINFRTIEACEIFLGDFNGVEVRKCLPGLNSRKVTEVTPARVQGFEENVQRLRNSPVMRELAYHQEWMPLIFDMNGEQTPFPAPERPLEPIKPRRAGRDDRDRD